MTRKRRSFDAQYKARVALEAIREEKTLSEIASQYGVHPQRIAAWKAGITTGNSGVAGTNPWLHSQLPG